MMKAYAVQKTQGRHYLHSEDQDDFRGDFRWDRSKILHAKAWRRMKGKTQVYPSDFGDHYRNRMTHSLEVASLSRDLAHLLGLNEDLAECIALAHDLGHPPFGHAGEEALDECLREDHLSFEHNEHSYRIVHFLEKSYPDIPGLNLCQEVLDGIRKHESAWDKPHLQDPVKPSLEAQVVNLADEITYQTHDCEDGLRSGILDWKALEKLELWAESYATFQKLYPHVQDPELQRSRTVSILTQKLMKDLVDQSEKNLQEAGIQSLEDVYRHPFPLISFSKEMANKNRLLKQHLYRNFYSHPDVKKASEHGKMMIKKLYQHYKKDFSNLEDLRDYLAGMTDNYAQMLSVDL